MAYNRLPDNLPEILRKHGLKVRVVPGWKKRGRPSSTGGFNPVGVLCHHTATSKSSSDAAVKSLLVKGRSDLPGPLCQLGLERDGTVVVIASGRANHAGTAKSSGSVAAGDGNELYIGIEAYNDGRGEPWPKAQYDAYVLLAAVLCVEVTGNSHRTVRAHKETSVTGKIDPTFNMGPFRRRVEAQMKVVARNKGGAAPAKKRPAKKTAKKTVKKSASKPRRNYTRGKRVDQSLGMLRKARGGKNSARTKHINAAIRELQKVPYLK